MNDTIRTPGLRKAMFAALALLMVHLGCTEDQHVEDQSLGGRGATAGAGGATNDGSGNGNGEEGGTQGSDGGGQIPGDPGGGEIPGGGDVPGNPGGSGETPGGGGEIPGGGGEIPGGGGEIPGGGGEIPGGGEVPMCGSVSAQPLTAGQSTDIGSIVISNDEANLYVTFATEGGWQLGATHVHVGKDLGDVPMTANGKPIPGQFEYSGEGGGGASYTLVLPLPEVECGTKLYVWAHVEVLGVSDDGVNVQVESAWGGNVQGEGTPSWFFVAPYTRGCC